jgi:hypothetical protein
MREALVEAGMHEHGMAREHALSRQAAAWSVNLERRRRDGCVRMVIEQSANTRSRRWTSP